MYCRWMNGFFEIIPLLSYLATGFPLETTSSVGDGHNITSFSLDHSGLGYLDDRFSVSFQTGHDHISSLSTHVNSILFLCYQALQDFEGAVSGAKEVSQEPWDDVKITSVPSPQPTVTRKLLVWSLYQGLVHFMSGPLLNTALYFKYDDAPQGFVLYDVSDPDESKITVPVNGTGSAQVPNTPSLLANTQNNLLVQESRRVNVEVTYAPSARVLRHPGLFLPMAGALQLLAESDSESTLRPFVHRNIPSGSFLRIQLLLTRTPQRFTVSNAICAIWEIAKVSANRATFKELTATVRLDRTVVAAITIGKDSWTDTQAQS